MEDGYQTKIIAKVECLINLDHPKLQKISPDYLIRKTWSLSLPLLLVISVLNLMVFLGISIKVGSFEPIFVCLGFIILYAILAVCWHYTRGFASGENILPKRQVHLPGAFAKVFAYSILLLAILTLFGGVITAIKTSNFAIFFVAIITAIVFMQLYVMISQARLIRFDEAKPYSHLLLFQWLYLIASLFYVVTLEIAPLCLIFLSVFLITKGVGIFGLNVAEVIMRYKTLLWAQSLTFLPLLWVVIAYTILQAIAFCNELLERWLAGLKINQ